MGAYLSEPVTDKISKEDANEFLKYGASSMQGWRTSQEDAHTCLLNFDDDKSLFAVFDGHGGPEVAQYCAENLPNFLKNIREYKDGDITSALEKAFIEFDKLLIRPEVVKELRILAGIENDESPLLNSEASLLRKEASMPIEDLIAKYSSFQENPAYSVSGDRITFNFVPSSCESSSTKPSSSDFNENKSSNSRDENILNRSYCSSSTSIDHDASNRFEPCTSSSLTRNCPNGKIIDVHKKSGSETDSVSSSVNETVEDKSDVCKVSSTHSLGGNEADKSDNNVSESSDIVSGNSSSFPTSNLQSANGETSQEKEGFVSTSTDAAPSKKAGPGEEQNDTSSTSIDEPTSSCKGKGKKKKIITPQTDAPPTSATSVYQAFLNRFGGDLCEEQDDILATSESSEEEEAESSEEYDSEDEVGEEEEEEEEEEDVDEDEEDEIGKPPRYVLPGEQAGTDSGCTAVVALLHGNQLYVANAGDSRCIISRRGRAVDMSFDHKPEDLEEKLRIEKAGGKVTSDGRINGGLNLSRAIGDHAYKCNSDLDIKDQMITAFPDVKQVTIKPQRDEFMVLACDGIWNSMSSQEVVDFVRERIEKMSLTAICEELFNACLSPDTNGDGTGCDNMTCVIVQFCKVKILSDYSYLVDSEDEEAGPSSLTAKRPLDDSDIDLQGQEAKHVKTE